MNTVSNISHDLLVSELWDNFTTQKLVNQAIKDFCLKLVLLRYDLSLEYNGGTAYISVADNTQKIYKMRKIFKFIRDGQEYEDFSISLKLAEDLAGQQSK